MVFNAFYKEVTITRKKTQKHAACIFPNKIPDYFSILYLCSLNFIFPSTYTINNNIIHFDSIKFSLTGGSWNSRDKGWVIPFETTSWSSKALEVDAVQPPLDPLYPTVVLVSRHSQLQPSEHSLGAGGGLMKVLPRGGEMIGLRFQR